MSSKASAAPPRDRSWPLGLVPCLPSSLLPARLHHDHFLQAPTGRPCLEGCRQQPPHCLLSPAQKKHRHHTGTAHGCLEKLMLSRWARHSLRKSVSLPPAERKEAFLDNYSPREPKDWLCLLSVFSYNTWSAEIFFSFKVPHPHPPFSVFGCGDREDEWIPNLQGTWTFQNCERHVLTCAWLLNPWGKELSKT